MGPEEIQRFHNDLAAAADANVPLDISDSGSKPLALTSSLIKQFESDVSSNAETPDRYQAALQVFKHLNLISPVLDGFSIRPMAIRESAEALKWTWRYLSLILATAFLGLYLFATAVAPVVAEIRADTGPTATDAKLGPQHFMPSWPTILPAIGIALGMLFIWGLAGGTNRWSQWLGGYKYTQLRLKQTATETIRMLLAVDLPWDNAVDLGCRLAGMDEASRHEIQHLNGEDLTKNLSQTDQINYLANRVLAKMKTTTPILVISVVGCVVGLLYCILIFHPLTSMLIEIGGNGI